MRVDSHIYVVRALTVRPGRPLTAVDTDTGLIIEIGRLLAEVGRALRGFAHPGVAQSIAWDLRSAPRLRTFARLISDNTARASVERAFDLLIPQLPTLAVLRSQTIHHDCHPGNILIDPVSRDLTGFIDFGDMIHAPLVFDMAVAAAEIFSDKLTPVETACALISGYSAVEQLETTEIEALYPAIVARHALTLTIHAWRARHDPSGAAKLHQYTKPALGALNYLLECGPRAATDAFQRSASGSHKTTAALISRRNKMLGRGLELSYARPVDAVRGSGVFVFERDGTRLLDCYNNVPAVGHGRAEVVAAIASQMAEICSNTRYLHETVVTYSEELLATMPSEIDRCLYLNSGSEAVDAAWRIAKTVTGRSGAIIMVNAYHGVTDAVADLSPYFGARAQQPGPHVETIAAPDLYRGSLRNEANAAERYASDMDRAVAALAARGFAPAALFVDSALTSNGILDAPPGWLERVVALARRAGALVVGDEVQFGFGRSGSHFWGFARHQIIPDMVTLGKPMANGHPVGAVALRREILDAFTRKIDYFSTFAGNPVSAAAALATLRVIQRDRLQENAQRTGQDIREGIRALAERSAQIGDVRGSGLMIGVDIVAGRDTRDPDPTEARRIANALRDQGVLVGIDGPGENVLKIRPPLVFGPEHARMALAALENVIVHG